MLWSRDGAYNFLQIRTTLFSTSWKNDWEKLKKEFTKYQLKMKIGDAS